MQLTKDKVGKLKQKTDTPLSSRTSQKVGKVFACSTPVSVKSWKGRLGKTYFSDGAFFGSVVNFNCDDQVNMFSHR